MAKKRIIIILFIIVFIFLVRQAQSIDAPIQEGSGWPNKIEYKAEGLKDPFEEEKIEINEQLQIETKPLPSLQIQGIVWGGGFPQAIINNKVVKVGDRIDEVQIINITESGITVLFENLKYDLSVPSAVMREGRKKDPKGGKDEELF